MLIPESGEINNLSNTYTSNIPFPAPNSGVFKSSEMAALPSTLPYYNPGNYQTHVHPVLHNYASPDSYNVPSYHNPIDANYQNLANPNIHKPVDANYQNIANPNIHKPVYANYQNFANPNIHNPVDANIPNPAKTFIQNSTNPNIQNHITPYYNPVCLNSYRDSTCNNFGNYNFFVFVHIF